MLIYLFSVSYNESSYNGYNGYDILTIYDFKRMLYFEKNAGPEISLNRLFAEFQCSICLPISYS